MLGVISQRIRRLALCADGLQQGKDAKLLAAQLQIFWKEQAQFFAQSRAIAPRKLADALVDCLEADRLLKGGGATPLPEGQIMGRLVMRLSSRFANRR